jgi:hypothetical protein
VEGIRAAKAKGVYKGRKPSIDVAEVRRLREQEKLGPTAIARRLGIGRASVYRVLGVLAPRAQHRGRGARPLPAPTLPTVPALLASWLRQGRLAELRAYASTTCRELKDRPIEPVPSAITAAAP